MLATYRREDAVMLICQDNLQKRVEILALNENAQSMLGYAKDSLIGKPLSAILPERESTLLAEYVEYEDRGADAGSVLGKMRDFHLVDRAGEPKPFFPKIIPAESKDGRVCFHLLLHPRASHNAGQKQREMLQMALTGRDYANIQAEWMGEIEAWQDTPDNIRVPSCIALLAVDQEAQIIEWYGEKAYQALWNMLATAFKQKLRGYDSVFALGGGRLGLMLLDTSPEVVRLVLNRLRWEISAHPAELPSVGQVSFTLSASYAPLSRETAGEEIWKKTHAQLTLALRHGDGQLVAV